MTKDNNFKISLQGDSININDMEIDNDVAAKVIRILMPLSSGEDSVPKSGDNQDVTPQGEKSTSTTPKEFMANKQPKSDMERIACLAFYLTHHKDMSTFKTIDLTHLNQEAAQPKISNPSASSRNAVSQQYLAPAGSGKKQITPRGEALVNALPDRSAVNDALKEYPLHGKRKKKNSKKK